MAFERSGLLGDELSNCGWLIMWGLPVGALSGALKWPNLLTAMGVGEILYSLCNLAAWEVFPLSKGWDFCKELTR